MRVLALFALLALASCHDHDHGHAHDDPHDQDATPVPGDPAAPPKLIEVPAAVRANLGITFANAELRAVGRTTRLPGRFEPTTDAVRMYATPLAGRVRLEVEPLETVEKGQLLATVDPPELRQRQLALHAAEHSIGRTVDEQKLVTAKLTGVKRQLKFLKRRTRRLGAANVKSAELETRKNALEADRDVLRARLTNVKAEVAREKHHKEVLIGALAQITGIAPDKMTTSAEWDAIQTLEIRALAAGQITEIAVRDGAWAEQGASLVQVTDPSRLRFAATALQGDVGALSDGMAAELSAGQTRLGEGAITVGLHSDPKTRAFPVHVTPTALIDAARSGLTGFAEIALDDTAKKHVAVPLDAVVQSGLKAVVFRRDPKDPDAVLRTVVEPGIDDGRWIVIRSGLDAGAEIVVEGAYELNLVQDRPQAPPGGHVHADGTVHGAH